MYSWIFWVQNIDKKWMLFEFGWLWVRYYPVEISAKMYKVLRQAFLVSPLQLASTHIKRENGAAVDTHSKISPQLGSLFKRTNHTNCSKLSISGSSLFSVNYILFWMVHLWSFGSPTEWTISRQKFSFRNRRWQFRTISFKNQQSGASTLK